VVDEGTLVAVFVIVTAALATAAPLLSTTRPVIEPRNSCADPIPAPQPIIKIAMRAPLMLFKDGIKFPPR
jgi:hypothetical protein